MPTLPQFSQDEPVINTVNLPTATPGDDQMSARFGQAAKLAATAASKIGDEESNLNLLKQTSLLNEAKNSTLLQMSQNPNSNAIATIQKGYQQQQQAIINNSNLNVQDKQKLLIVAQAHAQSIATTAQRYNQIEAKRTNELEVAQSLQSSIQELQNNRSGNAESQVIVNAYTKSNDDALKNGLITLTQHQNNAKLLQATLDRHQTILDLTQNQGGSAIDYHAAHSFSGPNQSIGTGQVPLAYHAQFKLDQLSTDTNFKDAMSALYQGVVKQSAVNVMSNDELHKYGQAAEGVSQAKGLINSGTSWNIISANINSLNQASQSLNNQQVAKLNVLKNWQNAINKNYLQAYGMTPKGRQVMQNFSQQRESIANSSLSPQQKQSQFNQLLNSTITQAIHYGKATNIPAEKIKPVPPEIEGPIQNMFSSGGDVKSGLETLDGLDTQNITFAANQMATPAQQEIIHAAGLLKNTAYAGMSGAFITANQVGNDYSQLKSENSQGKLTTQAFQSNLDAEMDSNATMKAIRQHLSISPGGSLRVPALRKSVENYVKYLAMQHNDYSGDHLQDYVNKATQMVGAAYQITTGSNFSFVDGELGLTLPQSKALAAYMTNKATEAILVNTASKGQAEANLDMNHLRITNTPDGQLLITDANGNAAYKEPVTQSLIGTATNWYNEHVRKINSGTTLSSVLSNDGLDEKLLP